MPPLSSALLAFQSIPLAVFGLITLISPASGGFDTLSDTHRHLMGYACYSLLHPINICVGKRCLN
jgi:hypothetical protein